MIAPFAIFWFADNERLWQLAPAHCRGRKLICAVFATELVEPRIAARILDHWRIGVLWRISALHI